uniref:Uncharacterized protein n=1 Tax=Glossina palpalis gambiensis TaxID=67801 RepID=A0A1B0BNH5_9MUSC
MTLFYKAIYGLVLLSVKSPKMLQNTFGSDILQINSIKHLRWAAKGVNALTTKVSADNCKKRQICSCLFSGALYAGEQCL